MLFSDKPLELSPTPFQTLLLSVTLAVNLFMNRAGDYSSCFGCILLTECCRLFPRPPLHAQKYASDPLQRSGGISDPHW